VHLQTRQVEILLRNIGRHQHVRRLRIRFCRPRLANCRIQCGAIFAKQVELPLTGQLRGIHRHRTAS
jgi:hypothetical protein